jgi:hypothetical protein
LQDSYLRGISGLLLLVDLASGAPPGTFFAVIGISIGIDNPAIAQYVGFGLHVLTGTIAGNIFEQISLFVNRLTPQAMLMEYCAEYY